MSLMLQNFATYCLQVVALVAIGGALPWVFRLTSVRARLTWFQSLLAVCLLLPAIQPWRQLVADSSVTFSMSAVAIPLAAQHPAARPFPWLTVLVALFAAGVVARLVWLAVGFLRLRRYLDDATIYNCPLARSMQVHAYVGLSDEVESPVTFGWRRPVILFPARFAVMDAAMQESIACHELLHVERHDWLFAVAEEFVRAIFWFHPAIWWLLGEIQLTREQVVDQQVVARTQARGPYLSALVAIASTRARLDLAPAPLFLRKRHLSQRVSQILKEVSMSRTRIAASFAGISSVLLISGWLLVHAFPLQAAPQDRTLTRADAAGVSVEVAEANLLHRAPVDYPPEAKAKGIQGTVVLEVDIDENGNVSDARVLSGPQELRKAALTSVLQWHYSKNMSLPAKTQVSVDFKLPLPAAAGSMPKPEIRPDLAPRQGVIGGVIGGVPRGIAGTMPTVAPPEPPVLRIIDVNSLPEALQKQLRDKLGKYEGQPLGAAVFPELINDIHSIDNHLNVSMIRGEKNADGSATATLRITLSADAPAPAAIWSKDAQPVMSSDSTPGRIRVGGNVQQTMLISQPRPVYPPLAKQARIQGVVRLNAIIAKDGTVANLTVVSGHPLLVPAALEAVKQWVYKTTLLNGEPVEVITVIDVNFTLLQ